jgi:hypothetical protein
MLTENLVERSFLSHRLLELDQTWRGRQRHLRRRVCLRAHMMTQT